MFRKFGENWEELEGEEMCRYYEHIVLMCEVFKTNLYITYHKNN